MFESGDLYKINDEYNNDIQYYLFIGNDLSFNTALSNSCFMCLEYNKVSERYFYIKILSNNEINSGCVRTGCEGFFEKIV